MSRDLSSTILDECLEHFRAFISDLSIWWTKERSSRNNCWKSL